MTDMYKIATQKKFVYPTSIGLLQTQDLWDLDLISNDRRTVTLNSIAKSIASELKLCNEENFVVVDNSKNNNIDLELKLAILKDIIATKIEHQKFIVEEKMKKERNAKIMQIISQKQDNALESKSIDELMALMNQ